MISHNLGTLRGMMNLKASLGALGLMILSSNFCSGAENTKSKIYASENCPSAQGGKRVVEVFQKGNENDELNEGYYQISFSNFKSETILKGADGFLDPRFFNRADSICRSTAVFEGRDGLVWILADHDNRPFDNKLVGVLYSTSQHKVLGQWAGQTHGNVYKKDSEVFYEETIPHSDLVEGNVQHQGASHAFHETDLKLVHHLTYEKGSIKEPLDLSETFARFAYNGFFKDIDSFKKYFSLDQNNPKKFKRWIYSWDGKQNPQCIFASIESEREGPKEKSVGILCREEKRAEEKKSE